MFGFLRSASGGGSQGAKDKKDTPKAEFDKKKDAAELTKKKALPDQIMIDGPLLESYPISTFGMFGRLSRVFIGNPIQEYLFAAQASAYERGGFIPPGTTLIPVISSRELPKEVVVGAYRINPKPISTNKGIVLFKVEGYIEASAFTRENISEMRKACDAARDHFYREKAKTAQNGQ